MLLTFEEIMKKLAMILDELNTRETSNNCVWAELTKYSWDELCDQAIALIKELGGTEIKQEIFNEKPTLGKVWAD